MKAIWTEQAIRGITQEWGEKRKIRKEENN